MRFVPAWLTLVDEKHGISHGSAHAAVQALGFTNQSIELIAAQRRVVNRSSFLATQAAEENQDITRFYFIDETSKGKGDMRRRRAYSHRGTYPSLDNLSKVLLYILQGNQSDAENHFCHRLHTRLLLATATRVF